MLGEGLPEFRVRRSARARRVRLTVNARDGLVVVVPSWWRGDIEAVVATKLGWARRALDSVAERRALHLAGVDASLPHQIELPALGEMLPVEYVETTAKGASARRTAEAIVVSGTIDDGELCRQALLRWLTREAHSYLPHRCRELSGVHGLAPSRVRITSARSRWGSCSSAGTISLNRNALFLPEPLVDSLITHELAHLRVMDHSPRFWSYLATLDPHALKHRAELKSAGDLVPVWADG